MTYWLQDFYHFDTIFEWSPQGTRKLTRLEMESGTSAPKHLPFRAAELDGRIVGVRPSPDGAVLFMGSEEVTLNPATDEVIVHRADQRVVAELLRHTGRGTVAVTSFQYAAKPEEFDTWEGRDYGIFDWLAERLKQADFKSSYTQNGN